MSIRTEHYGAVSLITIDRPGKHNALDHEHNDALRDAMDGFFDNGTQRVAVLTGAGDKSFCAGADLDILIPWVQAEARSGRRPTWVLGGLTDRDSTPKPIIAAVNGHALAGGLELALACDLRMCSPNATFGLAETKWALIPGAGGTQRLSRSVPIGHALEMIMSADPIDADRAERIGLVNRVVAADELVPAALGVAQQIAARGPLAVRDARSAVFEGRHRPLSEGLELERNFFFEILKTDDVREGSRAWAEHREPNYRGR